MVQRVVSADVKVAGSVVASIDRGLLLLAGFNRDDGPQCLDPMARRVARLRIFPDQAGRMQFDVVDSGGQVLVVPQFTLYGNTRRGRRPDFTAALEPEAARVLFDGFVDALRGAGIAAPACGVFGADMQVGLVNDGPVTLILDS